MLPTSRVDDQTLDSEERYVYASTKKKTPKTKKNSECIFFFILTFRSPLVVVDTDNNLVVVSPDVCLTPEEKEAKPHVDFLDLHGHAFSVAKEVFIGTQMNFFFFLRTVHVLIFFFRFTRTKLRKYSIFDSRLERKFGTTSKEVVRHRDRILRNRSTRKFL